VFDDYLYITGQYNRFGYSAHAKTKHNRNIPVTPLTKQELEELLEANGDGFVFSEDGGKTPVPIYRINRDFDKALERTGISHEEKLKRNLSFHAWRHFFNTLLRTFGVADSKVQSVTGHLSKKMTEHYTHFDTRKFTEVRDAQAELLAFKKPDEDKGKEATEKQIEITIAPAIPQKATA
jgi:integrase